MEKLDLTPGARCMYQGRAVRVRRVQEDLQHLIIEYDNGAFQAVRIEDVRPWFAPASLSQPVDTFLGLSEAAMRQARSRLQILGPLLEGPRTQAQVAKVACDHGLSPSTLYRWLRAYHTTKSVYTLVRKVPTDKGVPRVVPPVEELLQEVIASHYLTTQRKSVAMVVRELQQACRRKGLTAPGKDTVARRIQAHSSEEKVRRRGSVKQAREQFAPVQGAFPDADFPLALVQIDHTLVDLVLVDDQYRQPLGRPWLTVALDVFSRMVVGFYVSFDPPGAVGTGLCLAHALLPKELWLSKLDVTGEWPCWGVMEAIHLDNAREFRGVMLQRACEKYGIRQEWRPVGRPHFGGHIERLMGTFMQEVHTLAGTTFSNVRERKEYASPEKAALTLPEFERWLTLFIVQVYHVRVHQGIGQPPIDRYREGILGSARFAGIGLPERLTDELQVRLDFMPAEERTIQQYGVVIDRLHYYADVLRPYINSPDPAAPEKHRVRRKFWFKRDPRDISFLYFLDPANQEYHRVPYRDTSHPAVSIWEFRKAYKTAVVQYGQNVNEHDIFAAYERMRDLEQAAVQQTKRTTKASRRLVRETPRTEADQLLDGRKKGPASAAPEALPPPKVALKPFDNLYDASFTS